MMIKAFWNHSCFGLSYIKWCQKKSKKIPAEIKPSKIKTCQNQYLGQSLSWIGRIMTSKVLGTPFKQPVEFVFTGPLKAKSEPEKYAYLMTWAGEKGRNIYSTWNLTEEQVKLLESYYTKFEEYVKPRSNVIYNRYKFQ